MFIHHYASIWYSFTTIHYIYVNFAGLIYTMIKKLGKFCCTALIWYICWKMAIKLSCVNIYTWRMYTYRTHYFFPIIKCFKQALNKPWEISFSWLFLHHDDVWCSTPTLICRPVNMKGKEPGTTTSKKTSRGRAPRHFAALK